MSIPVGSHSNDWVSMKTEQASTLARGLSLGQGLQHFGGAVGCSLHCCCRSHYTSSMDKRRTSVSSAVSLKTFTNSEFMLKWKLLSPAYIQSFPTENKYWRGKVGEDVEQKSYKKTKALAKIKNKQQKQKLYTSWVKSPPSEVSFEKYNIEKYFQCNFRHFI